MRTPEKPIGPFTQFGDGTEVWIAERVLNLSVQFKYEFVGGAKLNRLVGSPITVIRTSSQDVFKVRESIEEVRTRLGWVSDQEAHDDTA